MASYLRTIIKYYPDNYFFLLLAIFEIVIEQAYLEHSYFTNSQKTAKSANHLLRPMGDMHGIDDEFSHVIGDAKHLRGIHFDVA